MDTSKLSINVSFEEPVYIDENTVEIYYTLGSKKQSKPIIAKLMGKFGKQLRIKEN